MKHFQDANAKFIHVENVTYCFVKHSLKWNFYFYLFISVLPVQYSLCLDFEVSYYSLQRFQASLTE